MWNLIQKLNVVLVVHDYTMCDFIYKNQTTYYYFEAEKWISGELHRGLWYRCPGPD